MNTFIIYILLAFSSSIYLRNDAVDYAKLYYNKIQHECGEKDDDYYRCTPFAYFGKEFCKYESHNGDCANFVSQCLVFGGKHENLTGTANCRGKPCGFEEPHARTLGRCLQEKGWNSTCGKFMEPPIYIKTGDVLIYHEKGCDLNPAHAVIITSIDPSVKVTGRSELMKDEPYTYNTEKPYYQWLHFIDVDDYGKPLEFVCGNCREFINPLITNYLNENIIKMVNLLQYNPWSQGTVELIHINIRNSLL